MIPSRIKNITAYLTKLAVDSGRLPPSVIIKGPAGTGKSWVLNQVKAKMFEQASKTCVVPVEVPLQLNGHRLVDTISKQISLANFQTLRRIQPGTKALNFRHVLFFENIDKLLNLPRSEGGFNLPKRAKGAGAAQFIQIQHASNLRGFLIENSQNISVIATTGEDTSFMEDSELPFFQFFNVIDLIPLNAIEAAEFINARRHISELPFANLFDYFAQMHGPDWAIILTDGKLSYLNLLVDTLWDLKEEGLTVREGFDRILKTFFTLYFCKLVPYVDLLVENLSYSEKLIIDIAASLPDNFYLREIDVESNPSNIMTSLKQKGVMLSSDTGHSARYKFKSPSFKAYLRFHKKAHLTEVLNLGARISR